MRNDRISYVHLLVVSAFLMSTLPLTAGIEDLDLPHAPEKWINGGPYAQEALNNNTVVFYFFEED